MENFRRRSIFCFSIFAFFSKWPPFTSKNARFGTLAAIFSKTVQSDLRFLFQNMPIGVIDAVYRDGCH